MTATIQTLLPLLAVLVVVAIVARRLNTAPSILLVIAGIGLALAPGLPRIELAPEVVLLLIDRDLILFITFGLIIVTLIGLGLVLPAVVRWLGLAHDAADEQEREHKAERAARVDALAVARDRLQQLAAGGGISPEVLAILQARHEYRVGRLPSHASDGPDAVSAAADVRAELIAVEREFIHRLLRDGRITDDARRRIERELDLEEASIACKKQGGADPPP
jgi:CPA1 family monovalent cation:H+ antiporter